MDFPPLPGEKHVPKQLLELRRRHDQIIQLHVIQLSNKDISDVMGVTERTVQTTLFSDLGRERIRELKELAEIDVADIATQITLGAARAIKFLNDVVSGTGEGVGVSKGLRYRAAVEMLRMEGFTPITRSINLSARGVLGQDGVQALFSKGKALEVYEGNVVEEEPIEANFTELIPEGS